MTYSLLHCCRNRTWVQAFKMQMGSQRVFWWFNNRFSRQYGIRYWIENIQLWRLAWNEGNLRVSRANTRESSPKSLTVEILILLERTNYRELLPSEGPGRAVCSRSMCFPLSEKISISYSFICCVGCEDCSEYHNSTLQNVMAKSRLWSSCCQLYS